MIFIRLLPIIFADILMAAHFLRFYGLLPALIILVLLLTLMIRNKWIIYLWQILLLAATLLWMDTTIDLVQIRIAQGIPWGRLLIIMIVVMLFTIFAGVWLENKKLKAFFNEINFD